MLSLATLCAPIALAQSANPAGPGTINYVEGAASIAGQPISNRSVGSVELQQGQMLQTGNGKVEMLLTPGVFLRLDENSAVKMISPGLTNTQVELDRGRAAVEVDEIHRQNNLQVLESNADTYLVKKGLYEFDSADGLVRVFKGQAEVVEGLNDNAKPIKVKGDHQLLVADASLKPADFSPKSVEDDLYNWSSLRSEYLAEANTNLAPEYEGYAGFAPGWYWDPAMWGYTWLPGDGMFWSPFGWGFYSPVYLYNYGPIFRGPGLRWNHGYHGGYAGHIVPPPRFDTFHGEGGGIHAGGFHGGFGGGFHGPVGGGFHGGGLRR